MPQLTLELSEQAYRAGYAGQASGFVFRGTRLQPWGLPREKQTRIPAGRVVPRANQTLTGG